MRQEYKIAKGWAIFIWIFLPFLMALFGWVGIMPFMNEDNSLGSSIAILLFCLGFEFLMILGLIDTIKGKLIIENDTITSVGVFKTKTLEIKNVKGFKQDQNYLYFIPSNTSDKRIKVSSYVGDFDQLVVWADSNLVNIDQVEFVDEKKQILENENFGRTSEEREDRLASALKLTKIVNIISWIVALSTFFYPHYYKIQIIACAALPMIGYLIYKSSNGLIKLDESPNSAHPNLFSTIFIPSAALALRGLLDFTIFDYSNLWKPAGLIFLFFGFLIMIDSSFKLDLKKGMTYLTITGLLLFGSLYAYGFLITTNFIFDKSEPTVYRSVILDKHESSGKTTTYYLKLGEWGPQTEIEDVSVSRDIYDSKVIGDSATVFFNHGFYKIPYYLIIE
ncbi:MAG: hypothetical protein OEY34_06620 [Cyclobacteriaceae bacterium]|nr:hypothetical protein [Cyclobacteriaceae bacterium]